MTSTEQPRTLRERKKIRTRDALAQTAVALFGERGFEDTPLDVLLAEVEVSRRTFFRNFRSKEDVALTAVHELWSAALIVLDETGRSGPVATIFRDAMLETIGRMDPEWFGRFAATLALIERSPSLTAHSLRHCAEVQTEVARRLGDPDGLELRLLLEFCVATWRCALDEWLPTPAAEELPGCVRRTFATMESSLRLEI
ncbi:TetR family transcriptional regulator [Nocardia sp. NPDC024068]|uniref:acyl-CoA-like ligand-binding transcription factor n=1 Tax=Nocardia sp. NPDC024068 TaxID=3157197 RepID=UPI0034005B72